MILVALLPSLVALAIFAGTFRLERGSRAPSRVTLLPPAPPLGGTTRVPHVGAARGAIAGVRIERAA